MVVAAVFFCITMARKRVSGDDVLKLLDDSDDSESDSDISWDKSDEDTIISDENETDSDDRDAVQPACCTTSDCGHSLAFVFVRFVMKFTILSNWWSLLRDSLSVYFVFSNISRKLEQKIGTCSLCWQHMRHEFSLLYFHYKNCYHVG